MMAGTRREVVSHTARIPRADLPRLCGQPVRMTPLVLTAATSTADNRMQPTRRQRAVWTPSHQQLAVELTLISAVSRRVSRLSVCACQVSFYA